LPTSLTPKAAVIPYEPHADGRPRAPVPANPADIIVDDLLDYTERAAKWLMEQSMDNTAKSKDEAIARQIEARNVAELQRMLERLVRLQKQRATDNVTRKNNEDLGEEIVKALRKIAHARRK